eukprot:scaffold2062_cov273-Chaetoceros_neogracile.AAC.15
MNIHSEVCLLDFGGGCEIPPSKLKECWKIAETSTKHLYQFLEQTLQEADEKAQQQRLEKLKQQQDGEVANSAISPPPNIPYFEQSKDGEEMNIEVDGTDADHFAETERKAEEAYRQQALDYSRGHVASKLREDSDKKKSSSQQKGKSLLAAMLKSVNQVSKPGDTNEVAEISSPVEDKPTSVDLDEAKKVDKQAKQAATSKVYDTKKKSATVDLDDDEEEETPTMLQSEFSMVPIQGEKPTPTTTPDSDARTDLSMAIKKKKKKSKKKK